MARPHTIDRLNEAFFAPNTELSAGDEVTVARLRDAFVVWLEKPMKSDKEIRDYLMAHHRVSKSQAYRDIANIKVVLGNVRNAGKEWQRHKVNTLLDEAYTYAVAGKATVAKSLTLIANSLIKNNRLDQEDGEQMPWDEIVPQNFEPTSDPTVIGLKPIPNLRERIEALKKKYMDEAEEVSYVEDKASDAGDETPLL